MTLVLSLFPGIGLLDMAFEEVGFCMVRGPDRLWGGDITRFHPPAGRFDGVIGGPPCQAFSRLVHIVRANGHRVAENLIPEYERCVVEAAPAWFLMENVPAAPLPSVRGYVVRDVLINNRLFGGAQSRVRRFSFGTPDGRRLDAAIAAMVGTIHGDYQRAVVRDAREVPVKMGVNGRPKGGGTMPHVGQVLSVADMAERQGLPRDFLAGAPLTSSGKRAALGNGVPRLMGRAVAQAVKQAVTP